MKTRGSSPTLRMAVPLRRTSVTDTPSGISSPAFKSSSPRIAIEPQSPFISTLSTVVALRLHSVRPMEWATANLAETPAPMDTAPDASPSPISTDPANLPLKSSHADASSQLVGSYPSAMASALASTFSSKYNSISIPEIFMAPIRNGACFTAMTVAMRITSRSYSSSSDVAPQRNTALRLSKPSKKYPGPKRNLKLASVIAAVVQGMPKVIRPFSSAITPSSSPSV